MKKLILGAVISTCLIAGLWFAVPAYAVAPDYTFPAPIGFNTVVGFTLNSFYINNSSVICRVSYIDENGDIIALGLPQDRFPDRIVLTGADYITVVNYELKAGDVGTTIKDLFKVKLVAFLATVISP